MMTLYMKYSELNNIWKKIYEAEWESVCHKSKAIAAVVADENGVIISEGRNKIGEKIIPNPRVNHAEVEAVRNLDIQKYPHVKSYTLYAALEPCPMCLGTLVMGGIRKVVIGAHDGHGGAIGLLEKDSFLASKHVEVTWMPPIYGDIQRGLQAIKELLYNEDHEKLEKMLEDFSVYNRKGVMAAKKMVDDGWFEQKAPDQYTIEIIFDRLSELIAAYHEILWQE